ncbi:hypothetical protein, partial [Nocardia xishanensis]|uniref:hypothetical protein n=1 Tax=Nocardia xishanensis TaxID=238964 RepID=UPI000AC5ECAE
MSSGGPGFDQTEWSGLLKGAQDGRLKLNVDAGALRKLVDACQAFVADILGLIESSGRDFAVLEWVYDNKRDGSHGLARPTVTTLKSMG